MEIKKFYREIVASSNPDTLEMKISKMVQTLLDRGHVVHMIIKFESKTFRRKYRAYIRCWILE